jgi:sporulation protein YqfC
LKRKKAGEEQKKWRENAADFFELPKELLFNLPRITLIGNVQLYLENHKGIIEYSSDLLRLKVQDGEIIIKGKNLTIKNFFGKEVFVEGNISSLEYH